MTFNFNWASVNSFLRQIGAVFGLVVAVTNTFSLPTTLRDVIGGVAGALLTAEHYANAQNPATPPQSSVTAAPTKIELSTAVPTTTPTGLP